MTKTPSDEQLVDDHDQQPDPAEQLIISDTGSGVIVCDRRNPRAWILVDETVSLE